MFKKFLKKIILFFVIITLIAAVLFLSVLKEYYMPIYLYSLIFCFAVTVLFHYILLKSLDERINRFSNKYMLLTVAKLFLYLLFVVIYLYFVKIHIMWFVFVFLILYALFSVFEVLTILSVLKRKQIKPKK